MLFLLTRKNRNTGIEISCGYLLTHCPMVVQNFVVILTRMAMVTCFGDRLLFRPMMSERLYGLKGKEILIQMY